MQLRLPRALLGAALLIAGAACASAGAGGGPARTSSDVLTAEEIMRASVRSAYEAIERLRPTFLRPRGMTGSTDEPTGSSPVVYVDGIRLGAPELLRSMLAEEVATIRRISPADAQLKYGLGHTAGVIDIVTRRRH